MAEAKSAGRKPRKAKRAAPRQGRAPATDRRRGLRGIRREGLRRRAARRRRRACQGQQGPALSLLQDQGRAVQGGDPQRHHLAFRGDPRADGDDRALASRTSSRARSSPSSRSFVGSRRAFIVRLLIAEGHKHPELTAILLREGGLARASRRMTAADRSRHRARRVQADAACATIRNCSSRRYSPPILWRSLFERHYHLDTDALLATNIDLLVEAVKAPPRQSGEGDGR